MMLCLQESIDCTCNQNLKDFSLFIQETTLIQCNGGKKSFWTRHALAMFWIVRIDHFHADVKLLVLNVFHRHHSTTIKCCTLDIHPPWVIKNVENKLTHSSP